MQIDFPILRAKLSQFASRARFVSLTYRAKSSGELARHTVIIGSDYGKTLENSILSLELLNVIDFALESGLSYTDIGQAKTDVLASLKASIDAYKVGLCNPAYTKAETYDTLTTGLRIHKLDGSLEIAGLSHAKVVIEPGTYKEVKSAPLTIAKNAIRHSLPIGKYRTFSVDKGALEQAKMDGETLTF